MLMAFNFPVISETKKILPKRTIPEHSDISGFLKLPARVQQNISHDMASFTVITQLPYHLDYL